MKKSQVVFLCMIVGTVSSCKEPFCVEGAIGEGTQYAKYDCMYAGGNAHHYHLGGSSSKGGTTSTSAGTTSTGGSVTGGTSATGGVETGGEAAGGDVSTGGTLGEGGTVATGGVSATGGTTSVVSWCSDTESANCLVINQSGGPSAQSVSCISAPVPYGNYTVSQNCPCSVPLGAIFIRTDSASSLKSGSLVFSGTRSFTIDFDIVLPPAENWITLATSSELPPGNYTVQLMGSICRADSPPPAEGSGVRMTWDGVKVALSTGLSDQILLGSYYAVTNTVIAAP